MLHVVNLDVFFVLLIIQGLRIRTLEVGFIFVFTFAFQKIA
jgi:hypothetical protein